MTDGDRAVVNAILRTDFNAFVRRSFSTLNPGATFMPNWHVEAICYHLELVRKGVIRRLIINVPPRSLKSTICSAAFPAHVLGHDPTQRLIAVSYGSDLAGKFNNDCRSILQSGWYQNLYPGTRISRVKNTEAEVITTRHGYRLSTSVGGTLTGRGGNLIIIDDPIKPQDAYSDTKREMVNDWYSNTLLSRLDDKRTGAIVMVTQRVHPHDLTDRLLKSSPDWITLIIPAIAEQRERIRIGDNRYHYRNVGDPLHPQREPKRLLTDLRHQIGTEIFSAQYQQKPVAPGGNMIKRIWVRRYDKLPTSTVSPFILQSYDTASKPGERNDWTVCTTWHVVNGKYYLADVLRGRFDYPAMKARAIEHAEIHRPMTILVEDSGIGVALIHDLQQRGFTALAVAVEYNKKTRMSIQSAKFESGRVFLPSRACWLEDLEEELFAFPSSRFDDQVDSISQALAHQLETAFWDNKSSEGFSKFVDSLTTDYQWGRLMGRPW